MLKLRHLGYVTILVAAIAFSQTPGQNTNMVSGREWPGGDPFLQRQNEPSLAISSRNQRHILAGANDYRSVDVPYPDVASDESSPCVDSTGKAAKCAEPWLGVFKSFNDGETWQSVLLPGYPQDNSPEGLASPLKNFSTGSDPIVRAGTNGMFYYSGMAFNRNNGLGVVFVAQYIDLNNKENGDVTQNRDSIRYINTVPVARGSASAFLDKPALAVDIPRYGAGTCTFNVKQDGNTVSQSFPGGRVYLAYTQFTGPTTSQIMLQHSSDCGNTWSSPVRINGSYALNQGANIQIDPETGIVYVVWRVFHTQTQKDAIVGVASLDGGSHFTPPLAVVTLPAFDVVKNPTGPSFFDQGTTGTSFRTNAYPALAVDDSGFNFFPGRVYLAWSQRGMGPNGDARIMMMVFPSPSMFSNGGIGLPTPFAIDPKPVADDTGAAFNIGHQFMPQMTTAGGKVMVAYYDQRLDHTVGEFTPTNPFPDSQGRFFQENRQVQAETTSVFTPFIDDFMLTKWRHTLELRIAEAKPSSSPVFTSARVSNYRIGNEADSTVELEQLQIDPPNLPMFQQGHVPFLGDYIDVVGSMFKSSINGNGATTWKYDSTGLAPVHHVSWTSNQDVIPPPNGDWTQYTPPATGNGTGAGQSVFDPTAQRAACTTGYEGTRNQNIYDSRITQGLQVSSPQNSKQLSTTLQRAFAITVQNFTNFDKSFRLTIANQPIGGMASFVAAPNPLPAPLPAAVTTLDVTIAAHSGIARTVFASSTNQTATITVNVSEIAAPLGSLINGSLTSFVVLNAEGTVPPLANPDGSSTNIGTIEVYNPGVSNPGVSNANPTNPGVSNPGVSNPGVSNPGVSNPNVSNLGVANPGVSNPGVSNPGVSNPGVSNPGVSNPGVSNAPVSDATYTLTNNGNTTASYTVRIVGNSSIPLQLILGKTYGTPVSVDCKLQDYNNDVLEANINNAFVDPNVSNTADPGVSNPGVSNATIAVAPGETVNITLRGYVDTTTMNQVIDGLTPVVVPQAPNTDTNTRTVAVAGGNIFILTSSLPAGISGASYNSGPLSAVGGTGALTWSVFQNIDSGGGGLPTGYSMDPATGTITSSVNSFAAPGTYRFIVEVADLANHTAFKTLSITLVSPLFITNEGLAGATVGSPYSQTLTASGGAGNYLWSASSDSTSVLPAGLTLDASKGVISGTPTAPGTSNFSIQVADSGPPSQIASRNFSITVVSPPPVNFGNLITFESYPGPQPAAGTAACSNCPVTTEFSSRGVVFSFTSQFTSLNNAQLFDSTGYDPTGVTSNHSVTSAGNPDPAGGFFSGVVHMSFAALPSAVGFQLRGNDSIPVFPVSAFDASGNQIPAVQITRSNVSTYTPNSAVGPFRQETVTITNAGGISRVDVDMNGFIALIDNLGMITNASVNIAPTNAGTFVQGQSFNETRGADVKVLTPGPLTVSSMTLSGFHIGTDQSAIVGARIYDSQGTLKAQANATVNTGGQVTVPISATLAGGSTYRVTFNLQTSSGNQGSGDFLNPTGENGTFFPPYLADPAGWLQVLSAWDGAADAYPSVPNSFVPQIAMAVSTSP